LGRRRPDRAEQPRAGRPITGRRRRVMSASIGKSRPPAAGGQPPGSWATSSSYACSGSTPLHPWAADPCPVVACRHGG